MPPLDKSPESQLRYFLRILAAIVSEGGGELRVPLSSLRQLDADNVRQALFEDTDSEKDELVLRFGTKNSAIYPVEPECLTRPQTQSQPQPPRTQPSPPSLVSSPAAPPGRKPLSVQDLAKAELKLRRIRIAAQVKAEASAKTAASRNQDSERELETLLNGSDGSSLS